MPCEMQHGPLRCDKANGDNGLVGGPLCFWPPVIMMEVGQGSRHPGAGRCRPPEARDIRMQCGCGLFSVIEKNSVRSWKLRADGTRSVPATWFEQAAVLILLTNDDGIYAPGLAALHAEMVKLGEVQVVAPATEQSGVGHMITYLRPLVVKEVFQNERMIGGSDEHWGWAVQGSPADCVKIGIVELCPRRPDLVVSGINAGLNAGINVLYSGTVAAAIEGAFYGITSIAVSLQFDRHFQFDKGARWPGRLSSSCLKQRVLNRNFTM